MSKTSLIRTTRAAATVVAFWILLAAAVTEAAGEGKED